MSETTIYQKANTLTLHTLDTFDVGLIKVATYICQIDNVSDNSMVQLKVVNDGASIGITQQGFGILDVAPLEFSANINANTARIYFTPTVAPTIIVAEKTTIESNNYAEHTKCGRLITESEGFALNSNNVVIRQTNNNVHAFSNTYLITNTLGPIIDGPNILANPLFVDNTAWKPYNDAQLANNQITTNNIYKNNFIYQDVELELGYIYSAAAIGSNGKLVVGAFLDSNSYIDQQLSSGNTGTNFILNNTNTAFFSVGHTQTSVTNVSSSYLYKMVPFNTYKQDQGTIYYKWQNVVSDTVLWTMETFDGKTRQLKVNANGDVQLTENQSTIVIGPQDVGNNKIAISYSNGITSSINGNSAVSNLNIQILSNMLKVTFTTPAIEFSYIPVSSTNNQLIVLSNG